MPAGYSGTPLAKKLGLKEGTRLLVIDPPADYGQWLDELPSTLRRDAALTKATSVIHLFTGSRSELSSRLSRLRKSMNPDAAIWVSWPKKSSKVPTDVTEDVIRELALPMGLVDIKVCAVSEVWSGLKLVIRKELRGNSGSGE
jgi:hypothetical protein